MRVVRIRRWISRGLLLLGTLFLVLAIVCWAKVYIDNRTLFRFSEKFFRPGVDTEQALKGLLHHVSTECANPIDPEKAHWIAKLEERLPLSISPVTVLREGFSFPGTMRFGPCGTMSELIGAVARTRGFKVRMVLLDERGGGEHKMVAVWHDGGYRLLDPAYNHYWVNEKGRIATIEEVRDNPEIFAQVFEKHPKYQYRLVGVEYFRWSRLGPLQGPARRIAGWVVGAQNVDKVDTPAFIDSPWLAYAWGSFIVSVPMLLLGWLLRPRKPREQPAVPEGAKTA